MSRRSSVKASPQPIQTEPITVAEIDAVGACFVAEMPFKRNESASEVRTPPTIHRTPPSSAPTSARIPPAYPAGASGASGFVRTQNSCSPSTADGDEREQPPAAQVDGT